VTLCLAGVIAYRVMVRRCESQGQEPGVARQMMRAARRILGKLRPQLRLLDALYFNTNMIRIARDQKAHVLLKFKEEDFREVTKDAQNLFQHLCGDEEQTSWHLARQCRWKVRKPLDAFAGYPVQVFQLKEYNPKRKRERNLSC